MIACRVCGAEARVTHVGRLLSRYDVTYHRCTACDFWCTEEPYWLEEAYASAIADTDTGLVQRNLLVARKLRTVLPLVAPHGPYVDWAGGYGLLVRLMRDAGLEFYWQDAYATNLLSRGFEWAPEQHGRTAAAVTAVEVLEHVTDPLAFVTDCLGATGAGTLVFTQLLQTGGESEDWWYLSPATGQHIAFYSARTLAVLADRLGLHVASAGQLHVLSRTPVSSLRLRVAAGSSRLPRRARTASLTWTDHELVTAELARRARSGTTGSS